MVRVDKAELLFAAQSETGESPVWDEAGQSLWWTDIPGRKIHRLDPQSGRHESFDMPGRAGCFALRRGGGLIIAMEHGFSFFDPEAGLLEEIAEPEAGLSKHRFNDGRCDREGRFLAGSMNLTRDAASAKLWRVDRDRTVAEVMDDSTIANGLAFDISGRTMYWVDGGRRQIFRFDYSEEGAATNRRVFQDDGTAPGRPDGGAVDAEGCYWSGRWMGGCVARFTPDGRLDRLIEVPASRVTMCAFGGADYRTLFITTAHEGMSAEERAAEPHAGDIFAIELDVAGLPEPLFEG
ncbi:SMP-30/gluconolactonase/LRE family protein [Rhizobium sp. XQZ8]|uniref:SMP-30/gluconolactonase/LRE family protein n=1 Tax=Rhizobium populisoli TaxID=2859785 RepID=UPI001C66FF5D|nr:SMP-30/gluconolactonase/LRE family protein [Rhizobium populisoli]MBW6422876.1 SMP-30/gluconolactonase/LRE family protein [Rhizobium populisoli]